MGHETLHWEGFGQITPQGSPQADEEEKLERKGRRMGLPPAGRPNGGGGI